MKKFLSFFVMIAFTAFIGFKAYDIAVHDSSKAAVSANDRLEARKAALYDYFSAAIFRYLPLPDPPQSDGIPKTRP